MDRRLLRIIIETYQGGPVGVETLAAGLAEPRDTVEDVYERTCCSKGIWGARRADASQLTRPTSTLGLLCRVVRRPNGQAALF